MNRNQKIFEKKVFSKKINNNNIRVRISKALSNSGIGSRRYCDKLISDGEVLVNNKIASLGQKISETDKIVINDKMIQLKINNEVPRIIIYNKQTGEISTRSDTKGRKTVFDVIRELKDKSFKSVGRLDINTNGLMIFTTSGDLANKLMHPKSEIEREYMVRVYGAELLKSDLEKLKKGIRLDIGLVKFFQIEKVSDNYTGKNIWYRVLVKEGKNREIRKMFEHFNLTVSRLIRVRFGIITMPSFLRRGSYYELNKFEVAKIMKTYGLEA